MSDPKARCGVGRAPAPSHPPWSGRRPHRPGPGELTASPQPEELFRGKHRLRTREAPGEVQRAGVQSHHREEREKEQAGPTEGRLVYSLTPGSAITKRPHSLSHCRSLGQSKTSEKDFATPRPARWKGNTFSYTKELHKSPSSPPSEADIFCLCQLYFFFKLLPLWRPL